MVKEKSTLVRYKWLVIMTDRLSYGNHDIKQRAMYIISS